jgi:hypothetical protein
MKIEPSELIISQPTEVWTDEEWNTFAIWINELLRTTEVLITFTKKDGSERVMRCTLNPDVLPKKEINEERTSRKISTTSIPVFDLDTQAWRSFTVRSVKNVYSSLI